MLRARLLDARGPYQTGLNGPIRQCAVGAEFIVVTASEDDSISHLYRSGCAPY